MLVILPMVLQGQNIIELDTSLWDISADAYILESYEGYDAIYLKSGTITPRNVSFTNGTIEYDIFLKNEQSFPGVYFRQVDTGDAEHFYIRPHLPGKPDANQVIPLTKGIAAWQFYFGPKYSFPYDYAYDRWTHVKIKVLDGRAQVFLDYSEKPHISWEPFHKQRAGSVIFSGGNRSGMHLANIQIDLNDPVIEDFEPLTRAPIDDIVDTWSVSQKFDESRLEDLAGLEDMISEMQWLGEVRVEEGVAANISRLVGLRDDTPGNTVFAKVVIDSKRDQTKLFRFGYSDRVVAILNGEPIYSGNNGYRSRDYRYLGTIGLFDAVYLNLKKGVNTLVFAVSESFGGWLITGKFEDQSGVEVKYP